MKTFVTLFIIAAASSACDKAHYVGTTETTGATVEPADNTKMNARDRAGAMTPMDQGNSQVDVDTTQAIRKAVMADDTLSTDAKNVKIITNNGVITLRGPVRTDVEKMNVDAKARAAAGTNRVDDQLDIASK